jgi:hypothetical protein
MSDLELPYSLMPELGDVQGSEHVEQRDFKPH